MAKNIRPGKNSLISTITQDRRTDFSSLTNLMLKIDIHIKIGTIITCCYSVGSIVLSIIYSFTNDSRILTFEYGKQTARPNIYEINLIMFYIFLILICGMDIILILYLVKEREPMLIKIIYSDLRWFFVLTQLLFGSLFLVGIIWPKENFSLILSVALNFLVISK
jgi:hypothetical protein